MRFVSTLRSCRAYPAASGQAMALRIFLSYAREDLEAAKQLDRELSFDETIPIEIWFDQRSLPGGANWKAEIKKAIKDSDVFLLLLSQAATTKSGFVQSEIREALEVLNTLPEQETFVIPVRLEECDVHFGFLEELSWIDLFPDQEEGMSRLRATLQRLAGTDEREPVARRIYTRAHQIAQQANLGPYEFVPDWSIEGEVEPKIHHWIHLRGGLFVSSGDDPDWLWQIEPVHERRDIDIRTALALRDALAFRSAETDKPVKLHHLAVVPEENPTTSVLGYIDRSSRLFRLLEKKLRVEVTGEAGLDAGILDFLWWDGKSAFWDGA
jgi:TIR domain-containing protein